jgi:hypothetical protein
LSGFYSDFSLASLNLFTSKTAKKHSKMHLSEAAFFTYLQNHVAYLRFSFSLTANLFFTVYPGGGRLTDWKKILIWRSLLMSLQRKSTRLLPFQGPEKSRFSGPSPINGPRIGFARNKIITSRAILTKGTLIVSILLSEMS